MKHVPSLPTLPDGPLTDMLEQGPNWQLLEAAPDYRMELIETLAELAMWQATIDDPDPVQATLARIQAVVRS